MIHSSCITFYPITARRAPCCARGLHRRKSSARPSFPQNRGVIWTKQAQRELCRPERTMRNRWCCRTFLHLFAKRRRAAGSSRARADERPAQGFLRINRALFTHHHHWCACRSPVIGLFRRLSSRTRQLTRAPYGSSSGNRRAPRRQ